jgi:phosphoserine phosphatase RsbU/P
MDAPREIVVADDEATMRHLLTRALERWGFDVTPCAEGQEALRAVAAREGHALLVLDYAMPGLNGAEVCRVLRAHGNPLVAQTPIILLTAHAGEKLELECLRAGADDFVSKPVHLPVLRARIATHFRLAALRAQLREQNQELEAWRTLHEADLEAAGLIQRALIPRALPEIPGWRGALFSQPVIQVGGDNFGVLTLPDGALLAWIADATGHGVAAALVTVLLGLLFFNAVESGGEPGAVLERVNQQFLSIFQGRTILTAACARIRGREVRFAGAGHPPGLMIRHNGTVDLLESASPPLGLPTEAFPECHATVTPGDALLLVTDGIFNRHRRLSFAELGHALARAHADGPDALIHAALTTARDPAAPFDDDVALLALWKD